MTRLTVTLTAEERAALRAIAEREMRGLREQARYLIIRALAAEIATQSSAPTTPQAGQEAAHGH